MNKNDKYKPISKLSNSFLLTNGYNPALEECPWIKEIVITKDFDPPQELLNNRNIKHLLISDSIDLKNNVKIYKSRVALFQSIFMINTIWKINYIWNSYFIMCDLYTKIPEGITHVNIPLNGNGVQNYFTLCYSYLNKPDNYVINFPLTIIAIRMWINYDMDNIMEIIKLLSNLPYSLEKLTFSSEIDQYTNIEQRKVFFEKLIEKIKIPFGCEIIIDG
jgi:hypothetical protein